MLRSFIILGFLVCKGLTCFAQNPDGKMFFTIVKGHEKMVFELRYADSVFYDAQQKYRLKISGCLIKNIWGAYSDKEIRYSFITEKNGGTSYLRDSTRMVLAFKWIDKIRVEIEEAGTKTKQRIEFRNVKQNSFSTTIKFMEGNFKVNLLEVINGRNESDVYVGQEYYRNINKMVGDEGRIEKVQITKCSE